MANHLYFNVRVIHCRSDVTPPAAQLIQKDFYTNSVGAMIIDYTHTRRGPQMIRFMNRIRTRYPAQ
jgi:hypothetical protein